MGGLQSKAERKHSLSTQPVLQCWLRLGGVTLQSLLLPLVSLWMSFVTKRKSCLCPEAQQFSGALSSNKRHQQGPSVSVETPGLITRKSDTTQSKCSVWNLSARLCSGLVCFSRYLHMGNHKPLSEISVDVTTKSLGGRDGGEELQIPSVDSHCWFPLKGFPKAAAVSRLLSPDLPWHRSVFSETAFYMAFEDNCLETLDLQ